MNNLIASRFSKGNFIFPIKINIDQLGVTLKKPGLFNSKEKTIPFSRISSVDVNCPIAGFSTIIIQTTGEGEINAHGFRKREVNEMKKLILEKITVD